MNAPAPDVEALMRRAIALARLGEGFVHPNPLVGAVLVKNGDIIGEGYHMEVGRPHAEINAIAAARAAGHDVAGATMVVTLEPCAHFGRTPPCVEALVAAGIAHVYLGMIDPNPRVSGRGIGYLRENGVGVTERVLERECAAINTAFVKYITTRRPYVIIKAAMTLDGKIATRTGASRWISSAESLRYAHELRRTNQAILVGAGTVHHDDPQLTCRLEGVRVRHPVRIVVDGRLSIREDARVVSGGLPGVTVIATTAASDEAKRRRLADAGCEVLMLPGADGKIDFRDLMNALGEMKVASLMIEGGATMLAAALDADVVDRIHLVVAPKIFGGRDAPSVIGGRGVDEVADAWRLVDVKVSRLGDDVLIEGDVRRGEIAPDVTGP